MKSRSIAGVGMAVEVEAGGVDGAEAVGAVEAVTAGIEIVALVEVTDDAGAVTVAALEVVVGVANGD